jgi:hypothetical protein
MPTPCERVPLVALRTAHSRQRQPERARFCSQIGRKNIFVRPFGESARQPRPARYRPDDVPLLAEALLGVR